MYDSEHIILVDDDDDDRELHRAVLRKAGFTGELSSFGSATDAVSALTCALLTGRRTLLLVDVNMPILDGFGLVAALVGTLEVHSEVSIVMLSGFEGGHDFLQARSTPLISDYFVKPLTLDGSLQLMNKYLSRVS